MEYAVIATDETVSNIIVVDPATVDAWAADAGLTVRPIQPGDEMPSRVVEAAPNPKADAYDALASTLEASPLASERALAEQYRTIAALERA